jgi:hypothetical protein
MSKQHEIGPVQPWWRFKIVWLALGGPAVVVVASLVTLVIALRAGDRPMPAGNDASEADSSSATVPALQARNHVVAAKR